MLSYYFLACVEQNMATVADLLAAFDVDLYPASSAQRQAASFALVRQAIGHDQLAVAAPRDDPLLAGFDGEQSDFANGQMLRVCPLTHANAAALRMALPYLQPRPLGLVTSAGCGDRLGLATPGHVRAFHSVARQPGAQPVAAIFAQQSIREMARTNRTPDDVLDDATWGAFAAGWGGPVGADADHLKTVEDVDRCVAAGYSFYTFDPGAYVDSAAGTATAPEIEHRLNALPWPALESSPADVRRLYSGRTVDLGDRRMTLADDAVARGAVKYGAAVAHVAALYRHLAGQGIPFEVEVSVDETETPTTHTEHIYITGELKRLGVRWVSLAPRYVGRFEKGVDYIGDLEALREDLAGHAAIARALGPYKLSLHSGSDKFSVYPLIVAAADRSVHLKTAGTSYLEALRVLAGREPRLFRDIAGLAYERYDTDRASYHVSAELSDWVDLSRLADADLPALLENAPVREILHVTFGSALARFGSELKSALAVHRDDYAAGLEHHFVRHLAPFASV
jgi:hypothetical protein